MGKKNSYTSDIQLGKRYRDRQTGFTGHATALYFYEHSCERVNLKALIDGAIKEYVFDAMELECVETGAPITSPKTGGPHDRAPVQRDGSDTHR